jgi:hypothetical protein
MKNAQMSKACSKKLVFSQLAEQTRGETKKGVQPRAHEIKKQLSPTRSSHREGRRMSREVPQIPIAREHTDTEHNRTSAPQNPSSGSTSKAKRAHRAQGTSVRGAGAWSIMPSSEHRAARQSAPAVESDDAITRRELVAQRWERPWRGAGRTLEAVGRHGWIEEWSGVCVFSFFPPSSLS